MTAQVECELRQTLSLIGSDTSHTIATRQWLFSTIMHSQACGFKLYGTLRQKLDAAKDI